MKPKNRSLINSKDSEQHRQSFSKAEPRGLAAITAKAMIHFAGYLVPSQHRARWQEEWSGEIRHYLQQKPASGRPRISKVRLLQRSLGAFRDAFWLRKKQRQQARQTRARKSRQPLNDLWRELRFAARALRKKPGFTLIAVIILSLGIGANTAIFSIVNAVFFHSFPYHQTDRIVMVWEDASIGGGSNRISTTVATFLDWREQNTVFSDLALVNNQSRGFTEREEPLVPLTHAVTANYFDVLGVRALHGRTFRPGDDKPGHELTVILSYRLWQNVFGGEPQLIGQNVILDDQAYRVIGILPQDFYSVHIFDVQPDLWVPLDLSEMQQNRILRQFIAYGRLRDDVSLSQAQSAMDTIALRIANDYPETNTDLGVRLQPIREDVLGNYRRIFMIIMAAVGLVLLIACANVANLTLAKATERRHELALRMALGANRWQVSRQLLLESFFLALIGGGVGLGIAYFGAGPLASMIPNGARVPFLDSVGIDFKVLLFSFSAVLATTLAFGLAPAKFCGHSQIADNLKNTGRGRVGSFQGKRLRHALVIGEVALSLVLLVGAGVIGPSFRALIRYQPGFAPEGLLTIRNSLRGEEFATPQSRQLHFQKAVARLESLPEVESAATVSFIPPVTAFTLFRFQITGQPADPGHEPSMAPRIVSPGYFRTMGIPLRSGRHFNPQDLPDTQPAVIVNEAFANLFFPDQSPVNQFITIQYGMTVERQIVGVVGNVRTGGLDPQPIPMVYVPHAQFPLAIMNLVLRVKGDPMSVARIAEKEIWQMSRSLNVYGTETLSQRIEDLHWRSGFASILLGSFAGLALLLGAVGLYAVISYTVSSRIPEIGVRMALGARRQTVLAMVVANGVRLTVAGIACGLIVALLLSRLISSQLYGISASDPWTMAAVTGILLIVALLAALLPGLRATRVDPVVALRHE